MRKPPKLEPAEFVTPRVIILYVVNTYGCRLGLVCTVAVPCMCFWLLLLELLFGLFFSAQHPRKNVFFMSVFATWEESHSFNPLPLCKAQLLAFCKCFSETGSQEYAIILMNMMTAIIINFLLEWQPHIPCTFCFLFFRPQQCT